VKSFRMCKRGCVVSVLLINLATTSLANSLIQCNREAAVSWSYNPTTNKTVFSETNDNLSGISLNFDFGFLKLTQVKSDINKLFRQSVIEENNDDPLELEVRYESTSNARIERTSIVVFDPFCRRNNELRTSIIVTSGTSFTHNVYNCECLSSIHDIENFVR